MIPITSLIWPVSYYVTFLSLIILSVHTGKQVKECTTNGTDDTCEACGPFTNQSHRTSSYTMDKKCVPWPLDEKCKTGEFFQSLTDRSDESSALTCLAEIIFFFPPRFSGNFLFFFIILMGEGGGLTSFQLMTFKAREDGWLFGCLCLFQDVSHYIKIFFIPYFHLSLLSSLLLKINVVTW